MIVPVASKDPSAKLDYSFDWQDWLVDGDPIVTSEWRVEGVSFPGSSHLVVDASDHTESMTRAFLSGGVAGTFYRVVNRVATLQGRVDERSLTVVVENR